MNLNKSDLISLGKGLIVAIIGAALTYLTSYITGHDFGAYTSVVVVFWGVVANTIRKLIDEPVQNATGMKL